MLKALEESKDAHHRWLLEMADTILQQWAQQMPSDRVRQRTAAMSGILRAASPKDTTVPMTVKDLLWTGPNLEEDALNGVDSLGFDTFGLDPMWFENV